MIAAKQTNLVRTRIEYQRVHERTNSRVHVAIEWTEGERTRRTHGHTIDLSHGGCLAVVVRAFAVGSRVKLINLSNKNSCEAVVVWICSKGVRHWHLGLELHKPCPDFWGMDPS